MLPLLYYFHYKEVKLLKHFLETALICKSLIETGWET